MLIVGNTLVSEDIVQEVFSCELSACKGECCVQGDLGAPLDQEEIPLIEAELEAMLPFLEADSIEQIRNSGFWEEDESGAVTACRPDGACVFAIRENGITLCGMEKAQRAGAIRFPKPVSCHLYPIRMAEYGEFTVMNYHRWSICAPGCEAGKKSGLALYEFLRNSLIRKMGAEWYAELEETARAWKQC
jgi:hypothetical protein